MTAPCPPRPEAPQPDPGVCDCGGLVPHRIFPASNSKHLGRVPARWVVGQMNPCAACDDGRRDERLEAYRLADAQKRAGIAVRDRGWRWSRTIVQRDRESELDLMARARSAYEPTLGVFQRYLAALRDVAGWTPRAGYSIYIHGETGSGKTAVASALATTLLEPTPRDRVEWTSSEALEYCHGDAERAGRMMALGRASHYQGAPSWSVVMVTESELIERVKLGWKGDPVPLKRISEADALILDDLGTVTARPRAPEHALQAVQRLIRKRYEDGRPLVITSNVPMEPRHLGARKQEGIKATLGDRVYSRLREMCGDHVYTMTTDWRVS